MSQQPADPDLRRRRYFEDYKERQESFIVKDANGQQIAYLYFEDEPQRQMSMKRLSRDEAFLYRGEHCQAAKRAAADIEGHSATVEHGQPGRLKATENEYDRHPAVGTLRRHLDRVCGRRLSGDAGSEKVALAPAKKEAPKPWGAWGRRIATGGTCPNRPHLDYARPIGPTKRGEHSASRDD